MKKTDMRFKVSFPDHVEVVNRLHPNNSGISRRLRNKIVML